MVAGEAISFRSQTTSAADNATELAKAINAKKASIVIASTQAGKVLITTRHKGIFGKQISVEQVSPTPVGFTSITVNNSDRAGTGSPDISSVFAGISDEWINYFVCPFTDATNAKALSNELASRYSANRQIGARAFVAVQGSQGSLTTWGNARNSPHITAIGIKNNQLEGVVASAFACQAANSLVNNPAMPLRGLELIGINAPKTADILNSTEREVLLFDGISTYKVNNAGQVLLDKIITTYQTNPAGIADTAYLSINTPETLERIRYEQRSLFLRKYSKALLRGDGDPVSPGLILITPQKAKGELIALYSALIEKGWVEALDGYKKSVLVQRDLTIPNRLNITDEPNLVNQFDILAVRTSFVV